MLYRFVRKNIRAVNNKGIFKEIEYTQYFWSIPNMMCVALSDLGRRGRVVDSATQKDSNEKS
jgi:hypothetical protein